MSDAERELLLIVVRWMLRLEEGAMHGMDNLDAATRTKAQEDIAHIRRLIAAVDKSGESQ